MDYIYAAVFEHNDDDTYTVYYPDIPGCITEGEDLSDAMYMAEKVLRQRVEYAFDEGEELPTPSAIGNIETDENSFASLIKITALETQAVRRTISIPKWMDDQASAKGLSLSRVLQEALKSTLT